MAYEALDRRYKIAKRLYTQLDLIRIRLALFSYIYRNEQTRSVSMLDFVRGRKIAGSMGRAADRAEGSAIKRMSRIQNPDHLDRCFVKTTQGDIPAGPRIRPSCVLFGPSACTGRCPRPTVPHPRRSHGHASSGTSGWASHGHLPRPFDLLGGDRLLRLVSSTTTAHLLVARNASAQS